MFDLKLTNATLPDGSTGLDIGSVDLMSWATIVLSVLLTAGLWLYIASERGWVQAWQ